ncbi:hypothetical protein Zmor_009272 [Zophobas morio]|uniref:Uncharacterized protein n=1 Tax=Zophobas morio TaxID=2755281 RepID=A0AA38MIJ9_9CUCU|nr:hypothetical protein Zmor_009272 [Zophobas morio]
MLYLRRFKAADDYVRVVVLMQRRTEGVCGGWMTGVGRGLRGWWRESTSVEAVAVCLNVLGLGGLLKKFGDCCVVRCMQIVVGGENILIPVDKLRWIFRNRSLEIVAVAGT